MTATRTLYRKANVSAAEATTSIFKRFPNVELVSFKKKEANAQEAKAARAQEGELVYEATIRVAEFPDSGSDDKGDEGGDAPEPKAEKKEESSDSDSGSDSDSDDSGSDDDGDSDDFGAPPEHGHEGLEPKKLSPEEQVVHLLQQILDAVKGGGGLGGPHPPHGGPGGPPGAGPDLPDIGAPGKDELGGGLGGPGGAPGKPPLPPPVKEKSPIGAGAFAHVANRTEVTMVREDAGEIGNKGIIAEAAEYAPTHRVARIQRTGIAQVGDDLIDLAEANKALVTLVSK